MIETQQEKRVKVTALNREIANARTRWGLLTEQRDDLVETGLSGYEAQIAMLTTEIKSCERTIEAAAKEIMIRTGKPVDTEPTVKRGPGRPPKQPA